MKRTKIIAPIAIAAALLLAGCSGSGGASEDGPETTKAGGSADTALSCPDPGKASDSVELSGDIMGDFKLTSKTPVASSELERTVLTEGVGDVVADGKGLVVTSAFFDGKSGDLVAPGQSQGLVYDSAMMASGQVTPWASAVLPCAVPGQRTALVGSAMQVLGAPAAQLGIDGFTDDDSLVLVTDVVDVLDLPKTVTGKAEKLPEGFPSVKAGDDGSPTITIPKGVDAPEKLEVAPIIKGDGEEVQPGDTVFVNYRGVIWRTGEEFDSSWKNGEATAFPTDGVIGGFQKALEGQKVGSQMISIVPAEDGGYGAAGLTSQGHEPDDVMVFVLDILGTAHTK